jgi:hypothetical protein
VDLLDPFRIDGNRHSVSTFLCVIFWFDIVLPCSVFRAYLSLIINRSLPFTFLSIAVPLALKAQNDESSSSTSNANNFSPGTPSGDSSPTPVFSQPTSPGTAPAPVNPNPVPVMSRFEQTIDYLVAVGVSPRSALETAGTPQNRAATWISNEDQFQMDVPVQAGTASGLQPHTRFTERYALAVLFFDTDGANWKYKLRFLEPVDHCDWYQDFVTTTGNIVRQGVAACKTLGEGFTEELVQRLELSNNGLVGKLPSELTFVHRLTHFIMPFNAGLTTNESFLSLRALSYLEHLELQYCSLTGSVPEYLGNLRALTSIGLGNNFLEGSLPQEFFMLSNLELLGLDDNGITGSISSFSAFTNMESLYLEGTLECKKCVIGCVVYRQAPL